MIGIFGPKLHNFSSAQRKPLNPLDKNHPGYGSTKPRALTRCANDEITPLLEERFAFFNRDTISKKHEKYFMKNFYQASALALMTLFSSSAFAATELDQALGCSDGFQQKLNCEYVEGPQEFQHFSYCEKSLASGNAMPEIHAVTTASTSDNSVLAQDRADFEQVKDVTDANNRTEMRFFFNGQKANEMNSDTRSSYEYDEYSFSTNPNYANDKSWTHKVYKFHHTVTKTLNPTTLKWTEVNVGLGVLDQNKPNIFICYRSANP